MSNVVAFLEAIGQDASLNRAGHQDLQNMLGSARINPELRDAILDGDQQRMAELLGAGANVCCFLAPDKKEDEDEAPGQGDDEVVAQAGQQQIVSAA